MDSLRGEYPMSLLRVGIAQLEVRLGDREGNYARFEEFLADNWIESEIETAVILPEMWDVGYVIDAPGFYGDPDAYHAASFLGSLAKKYNCWFVGGSVFAVTDDGAVNRAMAVTPQGEYIAHYDKAHLIPLLDEDKYIRRGNRRTNFMLGTVPSAMAICYDLRFCEWIRLYATEGAEILFLSAQWPVSRINHWSILLQARAIENMMYVVACNCVGMTGGIAFGGHSMVIDPWGKVLYEGGEGKEFTFVEIETLKVKKTRDLLKVLTGRRPELYSEKTCDPA